MYSIKMSGMSQPDLFNEPKPAHQDPFDTPPQLTKLFELSVNAFYAAVHARMSGLPIEGEISRFIEKVGKAGDRAQAERIACDRGDPDVVAVQRAAYKVVGEIHRMEGFLRFSPGPEGVYTARCSPDYFILPALAEHFTLRFGETPWAIIDEKRGLCLCRKPGGEPRLIPAPSVSAAEEGSSDSWEDLWRLYHHSINNESRKNPSLQRQFMPERYQKYLSELK